MQDKLNNNQRQVMAAYIWMREHNQSIPDNILDTMKNAAITAFKTTPETIINKSEVKYVAGQVDSIYLSHHDVELLVKGGNVEVDGINIYHIIY